MAFLDNFFRLPDGIKGEYIQDICLANRHTGKIFYDKMGLVFIEMLNFVKKAEDLDTELDKWLFALKHLKEFTKRPTYLSGPEFDQLFNLAKYANLTKEERTMYNASLKRKWDNQNVLDYAVEQAKLKAEQKALEEKMTIAKNFKNKGIDYVIIAEATGLSLEEIEAL